MILLSEIPGAPTSRTSLTSKPFCRKNSVRAGGTFTSIKKLSLCRYRKRYVFAVANKSGGIMQAGFDVFFCQLWIIIPDNLISGKAGFYKLQDQVNHDAGISDARLSMTYVRIHGNTFYQIIHVKLNLNKQVSHYNSEVNG